MAQNQIDTFTPKIILGVAAHPDDLDFAASGSFAKWARDGAEVFYLILTNGNKGSADPNADPEELMETRRSEQRDACQVVGAKDVFFCNYDDGALMVDLDVKLDIARVIRTVRPDTVVTMDPSLLYDAERGFINHPDHRAAGQATLDAVYPLARDHLSFPKLLNEEGLQPHSVSTVLLTNFTNQNYFVDITKTIEEKMKALCAHKSQFPDPYMSQKMLREIAEKTGEKAECQYAEGFLRIEVH